MKMTMRNYFVYIITNKNDSVLYIGVTGDLVRRLYEHRQKSVNGFSSAYNLNKLVFFESTNDVYSALEREKQLKKWSRTKKEWLIETINPHWRDMSENIPELQI
jgi:putative endonuclease